MVVVVDIVVEFHDGREREKKNRMVSAVFDRVFFFFVRRQSQSRFFPLSFSLLDDDSLVFATKALPSTFGITLSSLSRKKTRERETPRRRRRPEEDEKTASPMFLVVVFVERRHHA
tara:strand:+ start:2781 stop:3128 length:348 start_codon:yes stop_codon:yes gene_type:complete